MLSIEKEKKIQELISLGKNDNDISSETQVKKRIVANIRYALELLDKMDTKDVDRIKFLMLKDVPVGSIELKCRIPKKDIYTINKYYYLKNTNKVSAEPHRCSECGTIFMPPNINWRQKIFSVPFTAMNFLLLRDIATDLVNLGELQIISNPLFYDLYKKTKTFMEKYNVEKYNVEKEN
jgi:hypothetical protein